MATVSTSITGDESFSISMGDGSETASAVRNDGKGVTVDPTDLGIDENDENDLGDGSDTTLTEGGDDTSDASAGADELGELTDLGEYSDDKFDTFDTAYRTDTGQLNFQRLTAEFFSNADPESKTPGKLNEGTYQYLEQTLGIDRASIEAFEQGQLAIRQNSQVALANTVGGADAMNALVAWGRETYSPQAKKRFNAAINSGDPELAQEALLALKARHDAAKPGAQRRQRGPVNPQRSATSQGQSPGTSTQGYATRQEWAEARKAAAGNNKELALVQKRLAASNRAKWS